MATITSYHTFYRRCRAQGLSKIAALKKSKAEYWPEYVAFCRLQEQGTIMEPLDEQDQSRLTRIRTTGKLE